MIPSFKPGLAHEGAAIEAINMGAKPYPMLPYMHIMHSTLGAEIVDFLQGKETAEQALVKVEAVYTKKAKEQGFL